MTGVVRRGVARRIGLVAAIWCLAAAPACGLGDRAALEERITSAPRRAEGGLLGGSITVESRFVEGPAGGAPGGINLPAGAEDFEIPDGGVTRAAESARFELDLAAFRAALFRTDAQQPFVVMDDLILYGRRAGVPDGDARPWVRLDLEEIKDGAGEVDPFGESVTQSIAALHPALVTDLIAGTLTGSIETGGREEVNGVETTHYTANISIDKALGDKRRKRYDEDRREIVHELIERLGIDGNLHPAELWIDDDGLVRRFSVSLSQQPATRIEFALVVTVDYEPVDGEYARSLPSPEEVLSVDTVVRFIGVVGRDEDAAADVPDAGAVDTEAPAEAPAVDAPAEEAPA